MQVKIMDIIPSGLLVLCSMTEVTLNAYLPIMSLMLPYNTEIGIFIAIMGAIIWACSIAVLIGSKTTVMPSGKPSKLVTNGPFKVSRNPIYLGDLLILVGLAIYLGTAMPFAGALLFFILMDRFFIPREEMRMQSRFSNKYEKYKRRVRRWL